MNSINNGDPQAVVSSQMCTPHLLGGATATAPAVQGIIAAVEGTRNTVLMEFHSVANIAAGVQHETLLIILLAVYVHVSSSYMHYVTGACQAALCNYHTKLQLLSIPRAILHFFLGHFSLFCAGDEAGQTLIKEFLSQINYLVSL